MNSFFKYQYIVRPDTWLRGFSTLNKKYKKSTIQHQARYNIKHMSPPLHQKVLDENPVSF